MAGITDVIVKILGDSSGLTKEMEKVEGTGARIGAGFKALGGLIGTAFAVNQVKDWVSAAEEAEQADRRLEQTLRLAGDATGEWAKHAEDLANSLQYKTGVDDEVIKGGQAILATFHELTSTAGQQVNAFDRSTKAALDLSAAGFGSVEGASTMLGKALQDPERGLTALRRVGVNFTDSQVDMIKNFVAVGDQASAMNEILKNVEGQVGGTAEATATESAKMKVAWGETEEALGKALLPILKELAPILGTIAKFIQDNVTWILPLVAALGLWVAVQSILNTLVLAFGITLGISVGWIALIVVAIAAVVAGIILLWKNWDKVWGWITDLVGKAVDWVKSHIMLLVGIFALPLVPLMLLWQNWDKIWGWITDSIGNVVGWIGEGIGKIVDFFVQLPARILGALADIGTWLLTSGLELIGGFLAGLIQKWIDVEIWLLFLPVRILRYVVEAAVWLVQAGIDLITGLINGLVQAWPGIVDWFVQLPGRILSFLADAASWLVNIGIQAIQGLWNGFWAMETWLGQQIRQIPGWIMGFLSNAASWLVDTGTNVIHGLWEGIKNAGPWLIGQLKGIAGWFADAASGAINWLKDAGAWVVGGLWDGINDAKNWLIDKVKGLAGDIWDGFMSAIGIGSPSKLFMWGGQQMMAGLAIGLEKGYRGVGSTMSGITGNLADSLGGTATSNGAGATRNTAVVNIENAVFTDPVDLDLFMSKVAWAAQTSRI